VGSILTIGIIIGDFCIINLDCIIGHEAIIEDFVTVNPGVNIRAMPDLRKESVWERGVRFSRADVLV
jgi:acetyltransferase-like isoleucine patch superfamily enzyme